MQTNGVVKPMELAGDVSMCFLLRFVRGGDFVSLERDKEALDTDVPAISLATHAVHPLQCAHGVELLAGVLTWVLLLSE